MTDRPRCPNCGKMIPLATHWIARPSGWLRVHEANEPAGALTKREWRYTGNEIVVARDYDHFLVSPDRSEWIHRDGSRRYDDEYYADWTYEKHLRRVSVWDGETYYFIHGAFCSLKCAAEFGERAWRAGYRRMSGDRV